MRTLHFSVTPLAGAPLRIVNALRGVGGIEARLVTLNPGAYGTRTFAKDLLWYEDAEEIRSLMDTADIFHFHHWFDFKNNPFGFDFTPYENRGVRFVRQIYSHPGHGQFSGFTPREVVMSETPQLVSAQYHERYFPRARPVPHAIDLDDPLHIPVSGRVDGAKVLFYSPSNKDPFFSGQEAKDRWPTKGYPEVVSMLDSLVASRSDAVADIVTDTPHEECLRRKREAWVAIDDIVTGSFHLAGLESLAQGVPTLGWLDERTKLTVREITGAKDLPWVDCQLRDAPVFLRELLDDSSLRNALGVESRRWMERHWNLRGVAAHYLRAYEDILRDPISFNQARFDPDAVVDAWYATRRQDMGWQALVRSVRTGRATGSWTAPGVFSMDGPDSEIERLESRLVDCEEKYGVLQAWAEEVGTKKVDARVVPEFGEPDIGVSAANGGVVILDWPGAEHSPLYAWKDGIDAKFIGIDEGGADWMPPDDTVLVISAQTYSMPHVTILRRCVERGIPVLTLADGILEFRNTWRNPANPPGTLFMPVIGDKMACISRSQAARIASWGNKGVCEVIGIPALDSVERFPTKSDGRVFRLLVATANTAWFDDAQKETTLTALRDIRDELARRPDIEVWWRLAKPAADALGVDNHVVNFSDMPMERCIDQVDAVVSTPSTLLLYPMLQGKPAIALDYANLPQYCRFAWSVSAREQIAPMLSEIVGMPADLLLYQKQLLDEELEWRGSSKERLFSLIRGMCIAGQVALKNRIRPRFPSRIVPLDEGISSPVFDREFDGFFGREKNHSVGSHLLAELVKHRQATVGLLKHNKWLEEQRVAWMEKAKGADRTADFDELISHNKWLENQRVAWMDNANDKSARLEEQQVTLAELSNHSRWLEEQRVAWMENANGKAAEIETMHRRIDEMGVQMEKSRRRSRLHLTILALLLIAETTAFILIHS